MNQSIHYESYFLSLQILTYVGSHITWASRRCTARSRRDRIEFPPYRSIDPPSVSNSADRNCAHTLALPSVYICIYCIYVLAWPKLIWAKWLFGPAARHLLVIWCALVPNRIAATLGCSSELLARNRNAACSVESGVLVEQLSGPGMIYPARQKTKREHVRGRTMQFGTGTWLS